MRWRLDRDHARYTGFQYRDEFPADNELLSIAENLNLVNLPSGALNFRMTFLKGSGAYSGTAHFGARPVRSRMTTEEACSKVDPK